MAPMDQKCVSDPFGVVSGGFVRVCYFVRVRACESISMFVRLAPFALHEERGAAPPLASQLHSDMEK